MPRKGHWALATVALLHYGHDQCSGVGERVLAYWNRLSGSDVRSLLDRYVATRATADLAGARKALDIARGFLPRAKAEIGRGKVLDRLYEAETQLCHVVALPSPPRAEYEARLGDAEAQVGEARARLGSTLRLPEPRELAQELAPYLGAIELAAGIARESVRRELRPTPAPPRVPTEQERMELWFEGYEQAVIPAKAAFAAYLEGRRANDPAAVRTACKTLLEVLQPLLGDDGLFQAPDPAVEAPLRQVYKAMRRIGTRCTAGDFPKADEAYDWLRRELDKAARTLAPYSLQP